MFNNPELARPATGASRLGAGRATPRSRALPHTQAAAVEAATEATLEPGAARSLDPAEAEVLAGGDAQAGAVGICPLC